jgi:hypothetical protein
MNIMHSKAVTLTELLLAAAILAFVICGLILLFVNCSFLNEANRNLTVAMSHAQYIMEEIRNTTFGQIEQNIDNDNWDLDEDAISSAPYSLSALNNEFVDTGVTQSGDPLGVSVSVSWNDRRQRPRSVVLNTLLTDFQ